MDGTVNDTTQNVLETISAMIRSLIGEEADEIEIDMTTSFLNDLELESIEFVALAEKLRAHFGASVDFAGWMASMELKQILSLTVGDLVRFIETCTSQPAKV
jgi:acyl carrier protein